MICLALPAAFVALVVTLRVTERWPLRAHAAEGRLAGGDRASAMAPARWHAHPAALAARGDHRETAWPRPSARLRGADVARGDGATAPRVDGQAAPKVDDPEAARAIAASAYVVVDVKTGGTVREQRGEWLDTPVWPGSIAKLATYAAAIEAHTLTDRTRIVCTRRVTLGGGRVVDCSHPPLGHALSPVDAIAQSCNVFAASIARTLTRAQLSHGFVSMGLAPLPSDADPIASALGLDGAKVAPRRFIEPILRVAVPRPIEGGVDGPKPGPRFASKPALVANGPRGIVWDGLRESARTGTASAFARAGIDALAKTGTAPMRNGRALGLVSAVTPSASPRYAIVVALPGGSGAQAAETAAAIVTRVLVDAVRPAVFAAGPRSGPTSVSARDGAEAVAPRPPRDEAAGRAESVAPWPPHDEAASRADALTRRLSRDDVASSTIRIGRPRANGTGYDIDTVTLEDYVAQVVAGETSSATPAAAREALAITARTYAVVNRARHAADGFDVCSLTHCQVTRPASPDSRAAAERTRGRLLVRDNRPVPVFYSASCGGTLVDPRALLPDVDPATTPWLAPRPDPAGVEEKTWQTDIPARDLVTALQRSGYRGDTLRNLTAHTASNGLVIDVKIDGLVPSTASADDFRRAIGQQLGWHLIKSLRFTIQRTSTGYSFAGRGHGHGVGLCVLGASALAARGADAARILETYFPGLQRARLVGFESSSSSAAAAVAPVSRIALRLPSADERERGRLLRLIDTDVRELTTTLGLTPPESLAVVVHPTGDSYRRATNSPWWTSGTTVIEADRRGVTVTLHLAPLSAIDRHARLEQTLRHELVHVLTADALANRPRWVHEGLAIHLAGERVSVTPASAVSSSSAASRVPDDCPSDRELRRATSRDAFDRAYSRAAACVTRELDAGRSWRDLGTR